MCCSVTPVTHQVRGAFLGANWLKRYERLSGDSRFHCIPLDLLLIKVSLRFCKVTGARRSLHSSRTSLLLKHWDCYKALRSQPDLSSQFLGTNPAPTNSSCSPTIFLVQVHAITTNNLLSADCLHGLAGLRTVGHKAFVQKLAFPRTKPTYSRGHSTPLHHPGRRKCFQVAKPLRATEIGTMLLLPRWYLPERKH